MRTRREEDAMCHCLCLFLVRQGRKEAKEGKEVADKDHKDQEKESHSGEEPI